MFYPIRDPVERTSDSDLKPPDDLKPTHQACPDTDKARSFKFEVEDKGFLEMLNDLFDADLF